VFRRARGVREASGVSEVCARHARVNPTPKTGLFKARNCTTFLWPYTILSSTPMPFATLRDMH